MKSDLAFSRSGPTVCQLVASSGIPISFAYRRSHAGYRYGDAIRRASTRDIMDVDVSVRRHYRRISPWPQFLATQDKDFRPEAPDTLADLARMFRPMPPERVRHDPLPGLATGRDAARPSTTGKTFCAVLVDGVLVEKVMGYEESILALEIRKSAEGVRASQKSWKLWQAKSADDYRLSPSSLSAHLFPDVSFIAKSRLPKGKPPRGTTPDTRSPNLLPSKFSVK